MMQGKLDYLLQKQQELEDATSEIAEMRARAARDDAERAKYSLPYDEVFQSLELQALEAKAKLEGLRDAGENTWESFREGVETATARLKAAIRDFYSEGS